jgi:hypothetical protein
VWEYLEGRVDLLFDQFMTKCLLLLQMYDDDIEITAETLSLLLIEDQYSYPELYAIFIAPAFESYRDRVFEILKNMLLKAEQTEKAKANSLIENNKEDITNVGDLSEEEQMQLAVILSLSPSETTPELDPSTSTILNVPTEETQRKETIQVSDMPTTRNNITTNNLLENYDDKDSQVYDDSYQNDKDLEEAIKRSLVVLPSSSTLDLSFVENYLRGAQPSDSSKIDLEADEDEEALAIKMSLMDL